MTIGRRLAAGFGLIFLLCAVMLGVAVFEMTSVSRRAEHLVGESTARLARAHRMIVLANETARTTGDALLAGPGPDAATARARTIVLRDAVASHLRFLAGTERNPGGRRLLAEIGLRRRAYWDAQDRFFTYFDGLDRRAASRHYGSEVLARQRAYVEALEDLVRFEASLARTGAQAMRARCRDALAVLLAVAAAVAGVGAVVALRLTSGITAPLAAAVAIADRVAAGRLDVPPGPHRADETGRLMHALTTMARRLAEDRAHRERSEHALRCSEAMYRFLAEHSADVICRHDAQCRYTYVSPSSQAVFGVPPAELIGCTPEALIDPAWVPEVRTTHAAGSPGADGYTMTFRSRHRDGGERWIEVAGRRVAHPDGHGHDGIVSVMRDVSVRHEAERRLHESRELLAHSQRQARLGSWRLEPGHDGAHLSAEACRILGRGGPLPWRDAVRAMPRQDRRAVLAAWRALRAQGSCDVEHRWNAGGADAWMRQRAEAQYDADGRCVRVLGTVQDITDAKCREQELIESRRRLRALGAHHEAAREAERRHLAREIHDEIGQHLTALRLDASMIRMRFGHLDPGIASAVCGIGNAIDATLKVMRDLVAALRPGPLDEGLVAAAEWLVHDFARRTGIAATLHAPAGGIALDPGIATAAFRILQESLTNVARHAGARAVRVRLDCDGCALVLQVVDDGVGIDPARPPQGNTFGLLGMNERAAILGGHVRLDTGPQGGAVLRAVLPLAERPE